MRRMILGIFAVTIGAALLAPSTVLAAGPTMTPMVIVQEGFEGPGASYSREPYTDSTHSGASYGYWAPITHFPNTGLKSLWCEGTNAAAALGPTYRLDGGGTTVFDLSTVASSTADYYKVDLSLYYLLPSRGAQDSASFNLASMWSDSPMGSDPLDAWPIVTAWTQKNIELSDPSRTRPLSRHPGLLRFTWIPSWNSPQEVGEGPSIDDVTITGWRYGAVQNLQVAASSGGAVLTWERPWASTALTASEDREISYRVYRSLAGAGAWSELTSARLGNAALGYTDPSAVIATSYDYAVQCWEPGTGTGYGMVSQVAFSDGKTAPAVTVSSPASGTVVTSTAATTILNGTAVLGSGASISSVRVSVRRDDGQYWNNTNWQSAETSVVANGTASWNYTWVLPPNENQVHLYTLTAYARDNLGAVGSATSSFRVNTTVPVIPPVTDPTVTRAGGANRYDVAVGLAASYKPGLAYTDVIVACGEDRAMADPLAASGLAGVWDAPILLTPSKKLNASTAGMITAIRNANGGRVNIHVIGGTTSMPKAMYTALGKLKGSGTIERIDGKDRYAVAAKMASRVAASGKSVPGVLVANIENPAAFYDALAASPISARAHLPIVGVRKTSIPAAASAVLNGALAGKPRYAVNSAYLTAGVMAGSTPMASSGDRITAATQIAGFGADPVRGWVTYKTVGLANKLPDALTGGALVGMKDGVMLYTNVSPLAPVTAGFLPGIKSGINEGIVLGGPVSVSDATVTQFYNTIKP